MAKGRLGLAAALLSWAAFAQATQVSGSFGGDTGDGGVADIVFTCTLSGTTCTGFTHISSRERGCSNTDEFSGAITITGLDLAAAGRLQGAMMVEHDTHMVQQNPNGTCNYNPRPMVVAVIQYTGLWDGVGRGTFEIDGVNDDNQPFHWLGRFTADVPAPAAVFPMTVTGSITPTVANIRADIQFRPQDVGSTANVYVFALAPATIVRGAAAPGDLPGIAAKKGAKADASVACVLAQLNSAGQLQAVSASSMQAYASGVLSSQGQSIQVLNGVATVQIGGATFYVGYATSPTAMLNNGVNRSVVTAPAAVTCQPQAPQTGWWWNTTQGGRGFSMEVRGNTIFFASYLYDDAGRPVWLAASGPTSLDGSLFSGRLIGFSGGQTLDGAWHARGPAVDNGAVTLAFNDASHGTLVWPGGSIPIERFDIAAPGGHSLASISNQPESGWWWNPLEDGRGFFLEWQGGNAFIAGYMYDAAGIPIWYASQAATPNAQIFQGNWTQYAHGQTLTGPYQQPGVAISNVSPVTITFQGSESAVMTLPGGRTTALTRFRF